MLIKHIACVLLLAISVSAQTADLAAILTRSGEKLSSLAEEFANVTCTETVTQFKLDKGGKELQKADSEFDYLLSISADAHAIALEESRLPHNLHGQPQPKLMSSNGFATLFLVLHPYYQSSYEFTLDGIVPAQGTTVAHVGFRAIPGRRMPSMLFLRGKEYPLELAGTITVDVKTGDVLRVQAAPANPLQDIGIRDLQLDVEYAPVPLRGQAGQFRFASAASVELATEKQRWRNVHRFSHYQQFSVETDEVVKTPETK